jgi:hypothetical protein
MQTITDKLADVARRIAESEERIDQQLQRIRTGTCGDRADAGMQLYCGVSSMQQLGVYKARLEEFRVKPH